MSNSELRFGMTLLLPSQRSQFIKNNGTCKHVIFRIGIQQNQLYVKMRLLSLIFSLGFKESSQWKQHI